MAIFTTNAISNDVNMYTGTVLPTMEASDEIVYEASENMYKIQAGLYISDIMIEQAVTEGYGGGEALMEGAVKDFFKKILDTLKKFWAKVKAWFKSVIEHIQVYFMNGKKFIEKYKDALNKKEAKNFTYSAHKYDIDKMESTADKVIKEAQRYMSPKISGITSESNADWVKNSFGTVALTSSEFVETLCKKAIGGCDSIAAIKEQLALIARDMVNDKRDWKDFNGNSKADMIKYVEKNSEILNKIKEANSESDSNFKNAISAIGSLENSIKDNDKLVSVISTVSGNVKTALSLTQGVYAVKTAMYKEAYGEFLGILKSYALYKDKSATKESYEPATEGSILDSAMALL